MNRNFWLTDSPTLHQRLSQVSDGMRMIAVVTHGSYLGFKTELLRDWRPVHTFAGQLEFTLYRSLMSTAFLGQLT